MLPESSGVKGSHEDGRASGPWIGIRFHDVQVTCVKACDKHVTLVTLFVLSPCSF